MNCLTCEFKRVKFIATTMHYFGKTPHQIHDFINQRYADYYLSVTVKRNGVDVWQLKKLAKRQPFKDVVVYEETAAHGKYTERD